MKLVLLVTTALVAHGLTSAYAYKAKHHRHHARLHHHYVARAQPARGYAGPHYARRVIVVRESMAMIPSGVIPGLVAAVPTYVIVEPQSPNYYVQRGFEPIYNNTTLMDPRYNPALRDGGGA